MSVEEAAAMPRRGGSTPEADASFFLGENSSNGFIDPKKTIKDAICKASSLGTVLASPDDRTRLHHWGILVIASQIRREGLLLQSEKHLMGVLRNIDPQDIPRALQKTDSVGYPLSLKEFLILLDHLGSRLKTARDPLGYHLYRWESSPGYRAVLRDVITERLNGKA